MRRSIRQKAGVTATELADAVGCSRQTLRYWEQGRSQPRGRLLTAYAELLEALEVELEAARRSESK